ncbi:MAG TPA: hypothetical protein VN958_01015 [Chitinophagaceae bacterium]|nr:hypothetical protein [Chitinophagaceae bacterium]
MKSLELKSNIERLEKQIAEQEMNYKIALRNNKSYPALKRIKRKIRDLENIKQLVTEESSYLKV